MKQPIKVKILDHEYLIRSEEEETLVKEIAQILNNKFREVKENTEGLSDKRIAILAAFHIASEYLQLQKDRNNLVNDLEKRARVLNQKIDQVTR